MLSSFFTTLSKYTVGVTGRSVIFECNPHTYCVLSIYSKCMCTVCVYTTTVISTVEGQLFYPQANSVMSHFALNVRRYVQRVLTYHTP